MYEGPEHYECGNCAQQLEPCPCAYDCDAAVCACGNRHLPTPEAVKARTKEVAETMHAAYEQARKDIAAVRTSDALTCTKGAASIMQRYQQLAFAELGPAKPVRGPQNSSYGVPITKVVVMQVTLYFTGDYYAGDEAGHAEGWLAGSLDDRDDLGEWDFEVINQFELPQE